MKKVIFFLFMLAVSFSSFAAEYEGIIKSIDNGVGFMIELESGEAVDIKTEENIEDLYYAAVGDPVKIVVNDKGNMEEFTFNFNVSDYEESES